MEYVRAVTRYWWLIVLLSVTGALIGFLVASQQAPMYRSSSAVMLSAGAQASTAELVQGSTYVRNLVDSYVRVTTSELVLQPVADELGLDRSPRQLAQSMEVSAPLNTLVIDISVVDADPDRAHAIAAAVTSHLAEATDVISPGTGNNAAVRLTTISPASHPTTPFAPDYRLYIAIGLVLGAVVGLLGAVLWRLLASKVTRTADVAGLTDKPVIGEIIEAKSPLTLPQSVLTNPLGREAESLRALAANLTFLEVGRPMRSLVVTSGSPAEAKSSIATSLAITLVEASGRVLLIDADLRSPAIADTTNLSNGVGLVDVLLGRAELQDAVQSWATEGLDVLTSGAIPPNPAQLMSSDAMQALLETAARDYDHIILDTPPVLAVTDAVWLGRFVDGVVVVARRGRTLTRSLRRSLQVLASSPVVGVVLSRMPRARRRGYGVSPPKSSIDRLGAMSRHRADHG